MECPRCGKERLNLRILFEEIMCEECYQKDDVYGAKNPLLLKRKKVKGSLEDEG